LKPGANSPFLHEHAKKSLILLLCMQTVREIILQLLFPLVFTIFFSLIYKKSFILVRFIPACEVASYRREKLIPDSCRLIPNLRAQMELSSVKNPIRVIPPPFDAFASRRRQMPLACNQIKLKMNNCFLKRPIKILRVTK
jgi:hypothetical protein